MKKIIFLLTFGLISLFNPIFSQEIDCVTPNSSQTQTPSAAAPCFDPDDVLRNCTPTIYLDMNIHFILNDDCEGNIAVDKGYNSGNLSASNAFSRGEKMIEDLNTFIDKMNNNQNKPWNNTSNGLTEGSFQCVPIKFRLKDIYFDCAKDLAYSDALYLEDKYEKKYKNSSKEMNIFVADFHTSGVGQGVASSIGAGTGLLVDGFGPGLLFHEIGHNLGLNHVFGGDGCEDTWDPSWVWKCNGVVKDSDTHCWGNLSATNPDCIGDCPHPCCSWEKQNNNPMNYSAWGNNGDYAALTKCQVSKMLKDLANNQCDKINIVPNGQNPPPSASIGSVPPSKNNPNSCNTCFYFNASSFETSYEMQIQDNNNQNIINTGQVNKKASKYCLTPNLDKFGNAYWGNGFVAGQTYKIKLTVKNASGNTDMKELSFVLPPASNCNPIIPKSPKLEVSKLSPNPATNLVTIEYSTQSAGILKVFAIHNASSTNYGELMQIDEPEGVNKQVNLDISAFRTGLNSIVLDFDNEIQVFNIVKQ